MIGRIVWLLFLALVFAGCLSLTFAHEADDRAKLEVQQVEKEWREAWIRGDPVALDRIHADDYLSINYLGQLSTKAQVMADVRAGAFKYESMAHKDVVMRVYGDVVIVNARTINKGHRQQRDVSGEFRYTRVYVKRGGHWQAVLSQYTRPMAP
jgi:ketosteroid isomerase-like protein